MMTDFEGMPALVSLRARDYSIVWGNRLFRARFGEPDGRPCYALLYGRGEPCRRCVPHRVFQSGRPMAWDWLDAPDGHSYHVQDLPFHRDGTDYVLETALDSVPGDTWEDWHSVRDAQLADVQRVARLGAWEWDLRSQRITLSKEGFRLFGVAPSDFDGRLESFLDRIHPADRDRVRRRILKAVRKRLPIPIQGRAGRPDGTEWMFEARGRAVENTAGEAVRIRGTIQDITERKIMEREIRAALIEKEVLLREVHHRVKNNFQVVISLLRLQCDAVSDDLARMAISDAEQRIRAMATVHEKLYRSASMAFIDAREFTEALVRELSRSWKGTRIPVLTDVDRLPLKADTAVPCGLILNELLTNVFKHAFPKGRTGQAYVELRRVAPEKTPGPASLELTVRDDGVGLPPGLDLEHGTTLGLQLVHALATRQLGGVVEVDRLADGGVVRVRFPHEIERDGAGRQGPRGRRRRAGPTAVPEDRAGQGRLWKD